MTSVSIFLLIVLREEPFFNGMILLPMGWRTSKPFECGHCGRVVMVPPHRWASFRYCSRRCGALAARQQMEALCASCGAQFTHISSRANRAKYCSRRCYYKAQHLKGSVTVKCAHCEKEFLASPSERRKFCSRACVRKSNHEIWKPSFTTVRKALAARGELIACEACGFDRNPSILGVHHKDQNRRNNERGNLEVLCPNCHSERHSKHITHAPVASRRPPAAFR